jgi:protocatechuate 3,4-dioxygenase beta subunit
VLLEGVNSADYAAGLVEVAAELGGRRVSLLGGATMAERRSLETRVGWILDDSLRRGRASRRAWRRLLLGTTCLVLTLSLLRPFSPIRAGTPEPGTAEEAAEAGENTAPIAEARAEESYTFPISVSGRATDVDGKPISEATIYIMSRLVERKRVAETQTDDLGRYSLSNVPLPISTRSDRDRGIFVVFGQADGYGFSWRPKKTFYPKPKPGHSYYNDPDDPARYEKDDRIELDLQFSPATTARGRVLDDKGNPIVDAELAIWNCELIPAGGYGGSVIKRDRRPFVVFDDDGFDMLPADVPAEMSLRRTDADGRFVFTGLPIGCRFRIFVRAPGFPTRKLWVATQGGLAREYEGGRRLYDAADDIELVFGTPREVSIQVLYGDTGEPAPKVWVAAINTEGETHKTSDSKGRVSLGLPPGEYRLKLLPAYRSPYVETETEFKVAATSDVPETVARLRPAAEVEIRVVDEQTQRGIGNVDLWRETESGSRRLYYTKSWEVATGIIHRERYRADPDGMIRALFEPGKHRIGVAWKSYPEGYLPGERDGIEIDCVPGKRPTVVVFRLRRGLQR